MSRGQYELLRCFYSLSTNCLIGAVTYPKKNKNELYLTMFKPSPAIYRIGPFPNMKAVEFVVAARGGTDVCWDRRPRPLE